MAHTRRAAAEDLSQEVYDARDGRLGPAQIEPGNFTERSTPGWRDEYDDELTRGGVDTGKTRRIVDVSRTSMGSDSSARYLSG